ncbi:MAG: phosphomethylpyrimidine synthase ThiC [Kiritimatiellaeota bacterium]|nr:phosphomethylpyrimidine synthase ThiC [Kiritimatiellota bacterium]
MESQFTTGSVDVVAAAAHEGITAEALFGKLRDGTAVLPKNPRRAGTLARAIGEGLSTKINANIGASPYHSDIGEELAKLDIAVAMGADAVMDLSLGPQINDIRAAILERSPVMVGTVPLYQMGYELAAAQRHFKEMGIGDFLSVIERQAQEGVDFMTIHSGITRASLAALEGQKRLLDVVSRGGALLVSWLRHNRGKESPLYEHFDKILDILAAYRVTLSLGDGMRPGSTADATDAGQIAELSILGELTLRARAKGVQVIIEGPGHVPLNQVVANMQLQKRLCHNAPFYVLGPLVTDIAAGHDHIAGAIGGTLAALHGANFLCYVTPAEHLRLPTPEDVRAGTIASKIAAHAADVARGLPHAIERERAMARARKRLDWEAQFALCLDPEKPRAERAASEIAEHSECTMCGDFCAIKQMNL